jgi:hypothetical protein
MPVLNHSATRTMRRIPLAAIDAAVAARLGLGRVSGNAQPAVFSRQVAMYLAKIVGGWSTPQIGRFYNGRHHTTVCYAIRRVEVMRETNPDVDGLLTVLTGEAAALATDCHERKAHRIPAAKMQVADSSFAAERLDALAEQIANRVLSKLSSLSGMERPAESSTLK